MKNLGEIFSYVTERGVLSGLYIGIIAFGIFVGSEQEVTADAYPWILLICTILGLIIGNITYEVLIPILRLISDPLLVRSFHKVAGKDAKRKYPTYNDIRTLREKCLVSDCPERLKGDVVKDEKLRMTLAYLVTSSIACYLLIIIAERLVHVNDVVIIAEKTIVGYTFFATLIGRFGRVWSLGKSIGRAYLYQCDKQRLRSRCVNSSKAAHRLTSVSRDEGKEEEKERDAEQTGLT